MFSCSLAIDTKAGAGMKEIVIISGKGGTGKTSIAAAIAALAAGRAVFADCDVDAADLHLILKPEIRKRFEFSSGRKAVIRTESCTGCGTCVDLCRFGALRVTTTWDRFPAVRYSVDQVACEGCGVCVRFCPAKAIDFPEQVCGEWFISDTRFGPMVHARLGIAAENSGKLVTLVRSEAKKIAEEKKLDYMLIDGSPGIGCPVIASLTAADLALIVTEPTVSGDHDLRRIAQLTKQLGVAAMVCVNKFDINPEATNAIRRFADGAGVPFAGAVRYDNAATGAQRVEKTIVEYTKNGISDDIRSIWNTVTSFIHKKQLP
ncbi:MAG: ATP-binding protein [Chitinispirillaceae bacterium]|nr:ATP-binding protein [Chitinispirillaceae bacterium]